jgi:hypothetical protein
MNENDGYVVFVWSTRGYELQEREGVPPEAGDRIEEQGARLLVTKVGPSPLPGDRRPCVYTSAA